MEWIIVVTVVITAITTVVILKRSIEKQVADNKAIIEASLKADQEVQINTLMSINSSLTTMIQKQSETNSRAISHLSDRIDGKLIQIIDQVNSGSKVNRDELSNSLKEFERAFSINMGNLVKTTEQKLETMRATVDEKLHKTLEDRLGQSFKLVSDKLEAVQKGLGEMQSIASGVGDLKKVLSNVKTRGVLGEIQLGNILEQIMAPEQYEANVKTKKGSNAIVEFAIKLPGRELDGKSVFLPIDAKFPQENYVRLQDAFSRGDLVEVESASKGLKNSIKNFAKDIAGKYIDPPNTTDFGIMFLPVEGLYAEVVKDPELISTLQRDYKIIVTGPTTLAALLNSLHMGFKTLAIQRRSGEVWQILGAVKSQFLKFGDVLLSAQKKIEGANDDIEQLVSTRTRMMLSKLKQIEELPSEEATKIIDQS